MEVISLGWGTQSFALAAMSALGELPPVDVAIHADTTHEASGTYEFAQRWTRWLEERGVKVVTVRPTVADITIRVSSGRKVLIPAFTATDNGGSIRRQCTGDWKIAPMRRWLQEHRHCEPVEMWLGITTDEIGRVKESDVQYITHRWPLVFDRAMRRSEVKQWLVDHGLEVPPRSACYFCPYHSRREWRAIQQTEDWQKAVAVDREIRDKRPPFDLFLHSSRKPLEMIDFRSEQEHGQLDMFENECTGTCGI